jgi:glyoxylase-like metal-dependent hydrolase (beta-lactamase superfamily II)
MKQRNFASAAVLSLVLGAVGVRGATSDASYQKARLLLDGGLQAMGGADALRAVKDVWRSASATNWAQGQSLSPQTLAPRSVSIKVFADFANRRSVTELVVRGDGILTGRTRTVLNGDAGFTHNIVGGTVAATPPAGIAAARNNLRRDPLTILLTAASRAETLRLLAPDTLCFADVEGTQISLTFDPATQRLSRMETLGDAQALGDAVTEVAFSDYRDFSVDGRALHVPTRFLTKLAGDTIQDLRHEELKLNAGPPPGAFDEPKGVFTLSPAAATTLTTTKLGEDAYWVAGGSHHSWLVGFKDHVVVVEAPLGEDRSRAVMAKAAELFPGKPIRYVVMSHYHFDHSGGIRSYVAQGITVLTTPRNKAFLEKLAGSPHTIRPDAQQQARRQPAIETFTGKRVLSDGVRSLELYDVGPNPHAAEIVVAYLPKEKAMFVADLLIIPLEGPWPPASPALLDFDQKLKSLGLQVDTFAPAHGRMGKAEDLRAGVAAKAAGN